MKCFRCGKTMKPRKGIRIGEHAIDGWLCSCGEGILDPEQAQRALLHNKLKKQAMRAKLGRIRSNLILRVPKEIEQALGLKQGKEVTLRVVGDEIRVKA